MSSPFFGLAELPLPLTLSMTPHEERRRAEAEAITGTTANRRTPVLRGV
jgi:hypothetical protein